MSGVNLNIGEKINSQINSQRLETMFRNLPNLSRLTNCSLRKIRAIHAPSFLYLSLHQTLAIIILPIYADSANALDKSEWKFQPGIRFNFEPKYPGARSVRTRLAPFPEAKYQRWLKINSTQGIEINKDLHENLNIGASAGIDFTQRRIRDDKRFEGLDDIKVAPMARIFAGYTKNNLSVKTTLRSRTGKASDRGVLLEFDTSYNFANNQRELKLGFNAHVMDKAYANNFFSVRSEQMQISGLQTFNAKSGWLNTGLYAQGSYILTQGISLIGSLQLTELASNTADSPIVTQKKQISGFILVSYSF